jgi:hypothetical protein
VRNRRPASLSELSGRVLTELLNEQQFWEHWLQETPQTVSKNLKIRRSFFSCQDPFDEWDVLLESPQASEIKSTGFWAARLITAPPRNSAARHVAGCR